MKGEKSAAKVVFNKNRRYIRLAVYAVVLFVLGIFMIAKNSDYAYVELLCAAAIVAVEFICIKKNEKDFLTYIEKLDFCTNDNSRGLLLNYPGPLLITDMAGEINWYNEKFGKLFLNEGELFGRFVQEFVPEIQINRFLEQKEQLNLNLTIAGNHYEVWGNIAKNGTSETNTRLVVIYFIVVPHSPFELIVFSHVIRQNVVNSVFSVFVYTLFNKLLPVNISSLHVGVIVPK